MKEGCPRVKFVGFLVSQHQIVGSIDDDLLQANQGPQQPAEGKRESREKTAMGRLSATPAGPAPGSLPTNHPHSLSLKW